MSFFVDLSLDVVADAARRRGDHPAIVRLSADGFDAGTVTWGDLDDTIEHAARAILERGVRSGGMVALSTADASLATRVVFACDRIGAVCAVLQPGLRPAVVEERLGRLDPHLVVRDGLPSAWSANGPGRRRPGAAPSAVSGRVAPCRVEPAGHEAWIDRLAAWREGDRPAAVDRDAWILFTSGTTGRSKAAVITRANLVASAMASAVRLGARPNDRWLACMPLSHVGGLSILWRSALMGTTVVALPRFDVAAVARALADREITMLSVVPTMLVRLLRAGVAPGPTLRAVLVGGGPIAADVLREARAAGWPVCPTWGMTETASQIATLPPTAPHAALRTVGRPLDGTFVRVRAPGDDGVGELEVRGPTVMRGYLDEPQDAEPSIIDGWLRTGDLGRIVGGRIEIASRRTDLVVTGGENVYPLQVEAQLRLVPGVEDLAVVGVDDPEWGQRVACVVASRRDPVSLVAELNAFARGRLLPHQRPRTWRVVEALPLTSVGKLDRRAAAVMMDDERGA